MIFHENRLLADDSHEISFLISKISEDVTNLSSAADLIGALKVNYFNCVDYCSIPSISSMCPMCFECSREPSH